MTDAQSGWYLRHRDGVEHGPFQFADILEAARLGNVAADTCVRHERQTLDDWVLASRVQAIASVMKSATPRQRPARVARAPSRMTATPRRTTAPGSSSSAVQTPVSANASTALGTATTPGTATNLGTATTPGDAIPLIHRRHEPGYPVPKSFGKACLAFFDVRFRVFVTPWIITILWSLAILGLLIQPGIVNGYGCLCCNGT